MIPRYLTGSLRTTPSTVGSSWEKTSAQGNESMKEKQCERTKQGDTLGSENGKYTGYNIIFLLTTKLIRAFKLTCKLSKFIEYPFRFSR